MDKGTAFKLAFAAAVFGAMFMALWILGGMLIRSIQNTGSPPVEAHPDRGDPRATPRQPAAGRSNQPEQEQKPALAPQSRDTIAALIDGLSSDRYEERAAAEEKLVKIGERAVPDLERAAKREDPETSWRAAEALRRIREERVADK